MDDRRVWVCYLRDDGAIGLSLRMIYPACPIDRLFLVFSALPDSDGTLCLFIEFSNFLFWIGFRLHR